MPEIARYQRKMLAQKDAMDLRDLADAILAALEEDRPGRLDDEGQKAAATAADLARQLTAIADIDEIRARIAGRPELQMARPAGGRRQAPLPSAHGHHDSAAPRAARHSPG